MTAHTDETFARTWTMQNKKLGKHSFGFADAATVKGKGKERAPLGSVKVSGLTPQIRCGTSDFLSPSQAVCVTACGNFGIASSSTGEIHMWNMQSGIRRKTYKLGSCPPEVAGRLHSTKPKRRSVTGLATDSLNSTVIASTMDGTINVRLR